MRRDPEEHARFVSAKRAARMGEIDRLSPELRACVHDYGYTVVKTCMDLGVKKPNQIRHLVERILDEFSPTRGSYSIQGIRKNVMTGQMFEGKKGSPTEPPP